MKKHLIFRIILILVGIIASIILLAGIYRLNFTDNDILVKHTNGKNAPYKETLKNAPTQ